jgi:hypothetical protein
MPASAAIRLATPPVKFAQSNARPMPRSAQFVSSGLPRTGSQYRTTRELRYLTGLLV